MRKVSTMRRGLWRHIFDIYYQLKGSEIILQHGFLLDGISLGGLSPRPGPNGVHGKDGCADKDGAHDHKVDVEDAVKVVAHLREHGLQLGNGSKIASTTNSSSRFKDSNRRDVIYELQKI